jgi:hypothetical protein
MKRKEGERDESTRPMFYYLRRLSNPMARVVHVEVSLSQPSPRTPLSTWRWLVFFSLFFPYSILAPVFC